MCHIVRAHFAMGIKLLGFSIEYMVSITSYRDESLDGNKKSFKNERIRGEFDVKPLLEVVEDSKVGQYGHIMRMKKERILDISGMEATS